MTTNKKPKFECACCEITNPGEPTCLELVARGKTIKEIEELRGWKYEK